MDYLQPRNQQTIWDKIVQRHEMQEALLSLTDQPGEYPIIDEALRSGFYTFFILFTCAKRNTHHLFFFIFFRLLSFFDMYCYIFAYICCIIAFFCRSAPLKVTFWCNIVPVSGLLRWFKPVELASYVLPANHTAVLPPAQPQRAPAPVGPM